MFFGTCVASCCCHCQSWSKTCATGTGDLNHEKNSWWKAVDLWNTALAGSQSLLDATNLALDEANAQAITLQELLQLQAQTNEIIAETNIQITHAKSKEREEEEQGRISNFITIIIPIILILLTIGLIFVWKK